MRTADDLTYEIERVAWFSDGFKFAEARELLEAALSDAYAAGRAAGVEEAAQIVERTYTECQWPEDFYGAQIEDEIRALIPRPADDTPASPA